MQPEPLSPSALSDAIHDAFREWHSTAPETPLGHLRVVRSHLCAGTTLRQRANQILLNLLNRLKDRDEEYASVLRLRFLDQMNAFRVANRLNISDSSVYRKQREACDLLAEMLYHEEMAARAEHRALIETRLELPTYDRLFGVETYLDRLWELLETPGAPWIVLLQGIGGIGKTALADALMRQALARSVFDDFGWVTARQSCFRLDGTIVPMTEAALTPGVLLERLAEQLLDVPLSSPFSPQQMLALLQKRMGEHAHLVVIDNLETLADVEALLPSLRRLVNPTKFILTSRQSLHSETNIYPYPVLPLEEADALALVRHEAQARNLPLLVEADDEELRSIYAAVGGNPLALRLVVGQTRRHALDTVLADLRTARGQSVDNLYTFIYRRAWDNLGEEERCVFLAMPLVPEGGADLDFLAAACGLEVGVLHDALEKLVGLNLVDHRSGLRESRYTIHGLTRTFLLQRVLRW